MDNARVSYLIASYNHEEYIKKAVDSVLNQTYKNIELIVCDDKSQDHSHDFLKKYSYEKGFKYIQNTKNLGARATTSRLLEQATGEYIAVLGSDDWIEVNKVEKQVKYIQEIGVDAVYGPVIEYRENEGTFVSIGNSNLEKLILKGNLLRHLYETGEGAGLMQSGLFRAECIKKVRFLEEYKSDDFLFQIRFLQAGYKIGYLNEPLTYYRIHENNTHNDALYCLNELELPVIRDFIPEPYQKNLIDDAYCRAAAKLVIQGQVRASIKLRKRHFFPCKSERTKMLLKADLCYVMKKMGVYKFYRKIKNSKKSKMNMNCQGGLCS